MTARRDTGGFAGAETVTGPRGARDPGTEPRVPRPMTGAEPLTPASPPTGDAQEERRAGEPADAQGAGQAPERPGALVTTMRGAQCAALAALAGAVLPVGEPVRGVVRPLADVLVLAASAVLFAAAARRTGRRSFRLTWSALAAALLLLTAAAVLTALAVAGSAAPAALIAAGLLVALVAIVQVPLPRSPWHPAAGLGAVVVGTGAAALVVAALTAAGDTVAGGAAAAAEVAAVAAPAAALVAVLMTLAAPGPAPRPRLRWVAGGLLLVVAADVAALAGAGTPALLAPADAGPAAAGAHLVALAGYALVAPAATDRPNGRRADRRRRRPEGLLAAVLPGTVTAAALLLVAAAVAGIRTSGVAAGLALAAVAAELLRTTRAARANGRLPGLDQQPRTDDLTGLANRRALSEALAGDRGTDAGAGWTGWAGWADEIALLLVDLDRFKDVNEALGHDAGDHLLTEVGARLRTALRPTQMLARLGGDEFAVVLPAAGAEQARRVAVALRESLAEPFEIDGQRLHVGASIGIATCHPSRGEPTDLLRRADVAMYQAKASGGGIELYDPARDRQGSGRLQRIEELREALERGDLEVHLQPQVDLRTGAVTGAEALARWRHPEDGVLLPDSFLPLAEQTGLMRPVATLVLDRALAACAQWWERGHHVPVSVNLGAEDLRDPELPGQVARALQASGLPPAALRVEITEQALLTDPTAASDVLRRWRADGVAVAIDDFGTGYSSLSYLRELPVDEVKLDRAFVADIRRGTTATIVRHTVAMAHGLWARVVAEGIEDAETARLMAELGCDVGQGLHYGPAMATADFVALLDARRGGPPSGAPPAD